MQEGRRRCPKKHLICVGCGHCRCKGSRYVTKHQQDQFTLCGPCRYTHVMTDSVYHEGSN